MRPGRFSPSAPPASSAEGTVDAVLGGAPVYVDVVIPRTTIAGKMRLLGRHESLSIRAEAMLAFAEKKIAIDPNGFTAPGILNEWNCEIAVRHLAIAVRDPADPTKPLGSLVDWRGDDQRLGCDDDQIAALWQQYQDLRERLDPLAAPEQLTEAEHAALLSAAKKKPPEIDLLTSFGSRKLAALAISLADRPAS